MSCYLTRNSKRPLLQCDYFEYYKDYNEAIVERSAKPVYSAAGNGDLTPQKGLGTNKLGGVLEKADFALGIPEQRSDVLPPEIDLRWGTVSQSAHCRIVHK